MNEEKIKQIIRQEMQRYDSANRFRLNPINRHTHNGTDAPFVYTPYAFYVGKVNIGGAKGTPFPLGWTVENDVPGSYFVTHNLDTRIQTVNITPQINPLIASFPGCGVVVSPNFFQVLLFDTMTQLPLDNTFYFSVVIGNNKSSSFPQYEPPIQ